MVISKKLREELEFLEENIYDLLQRNSLTESQIKQFLINLEKRRYKILNEIKLYNNTVEYNTEKIKTISDEYKARLNDDVLELYIPEPMPSYKNIKTHAFKNILLNLKEITKGYDGLFKNQVFVYIKIFENIRNWDIDNKYIKLIPDSLIYSGVITDDNIDKMFYCVRGEFSDNPHTEVYISDSKNTLKVLEKYDI